MGMDEGHDCCTYLLASASSHNLIGPPLVLWHFIYLFIFLWFQAMTIVPVIGMDILIMLMLIACKFFLRLVPLILCHICFLVKTHETSLFYV